MSTGKNVDHSFTVGRHASVLNEERTMRPENLILFNSTVPRCPNSTTFKRWDPHAGKHRSG